MYLRLQSLLKRGLKDLSFCINFTDVNIEDKNKVDKLRVIAILNLSQKKSQNFI